MEVLSTARGSTQTLEPLFGLRPVAAQPFVTDAIDEEERGMPADSQLLACRSPASL
jgi:hypothetical protein